MDKKNFIYMIIGLVAIVVFVVCGFYYLESGKTQTSVYEGNIPVGKFKAVIGDEIVFTNGPDIMRVDSDLKSGVTEEYCQLDDEKDEYICFFKLGITISDDAAQRQADITSRLEVIEENGLEYLSDDLVLYLNDEKLNEVKISSELKGTFQKEIQIMGSGKGVSKEEAVKNTWQIFEELFDILVDFSSK